MAPDSLPYPVLAVEGGGGDQGATLKGPGSSPSGPTPTGSDGKAATIPRAQHLWIGGDHPEGWQRVGWIDIADPADVKRALQRGRRIGSAYDGGSGSAAEPCTADVYAPVCEGGEILEAGKMCPRCGATEYELCGEL